MAPIGVEDPPPLDAGEVVAALGEAELVIGDKPPVVRSEVGAVVASVVASPVVSVGFA